ncbi:IS3 family transposase [Desulfovibrio sp. UIB00]|nr:IS3 family transposase [Desulfovibrio sp. UIB00]
MKFFLGKTVQSEEETSTLIEEYIRFYNTERLPQKLDQLSPIEYREKWPLNLRHGDIINCLLEVQTICRGIFFVPFTCNIMAVGAKYPLWCCR